MISVILTPVTVAVLAFAVTVAVRVGTAWLTRGDDGKAIRAAGFRAIARSVALSTARDWRDSIKSAGYWIAGHARGLLERDGAAAPAAVAPPVAAPAPAPGPRRPAGAPSAPPELGDLGAAAIPAEGAPLSPDWAAVIARITAFEPADDEDMLAFMRSETAAFPALADAWRAVADTQLHVIGIDPAAVSGTIELADVLGDCAHDVVLAIRKFLVVYAEVQAAIAGGLILPHKAREFLTGAGS